MHAFGTLNYHVVQGITGEAAWHVAVDVLDESIAKPEGASHPGIACFYDL